MALKQPQKLWPNKDVKDVVVVEYVVATGDTTQPWAGGDYTDKSVHLHEYTGTGSIAVQGSNDPRAAIGDGSTAKWVTVKNDAGADCSYTADNKGDVLVQPYYFNRLLITGTATGTVHFCGRRIQ